MVGAANATYKGFTLDGAIRCFIEYVAPRVDVSLVPLVPEWTARASRRVVVVENGAARFGQTPRCSVMPSRDLRAWR